jgi:hypothetical protein
MKFGVVGIFPGIIAAAILVSSCKHRDRQAQVKTQDSAAPDACNLQAMEKASNEASKKAFECAYSSAKTAGKLSGGMAAEIAVILIGIKDVTEGVTGLSGLFADLQVYLRHNGVGKTAMYRCLSGQYEAVGSLYDLATAANGVNGEVITSEKLKKLTSISVSAAASILDRMGTLAECSDWMEGKRTKEMVQLSKGAKKIAGVIGTYKVIATCGIDLAKGGIILWENTGCLMGDMESYYESRDLLNKQRDNYVDNTHVPEQDQERGQNACMAKYGIFLNKQSFYSYGYKSSQCGDYCGNSGTAGEYMKQNLRSIYTRDDDLKWCSANATSQMASDNVRACAVYCCDQDQACANDAMKRSGVK